MSDGGMLSGGTYNGARSTHHEQSDAGPKRLVVNLTDGQYRIEGPWVSLLRQRSLLRIFLALVDEAERAPGRALTQLEVLARGWPGEKMRADSGAMRVYTSIRRLRRSGLQGILLTRGDGYLLDPNVALVRM